VRSRALASQGKSKPYRVCTQAISRPHVVAVAAVSEKVNIEEWNTAGRSSRMAHLEAQAMEALEKAVNSFEHPTFPCALIAGDVVILDLLSRIGAFKNPKFKVVFIDTFHLFDETYQFLKECEERYGFKAEVFHAADVPDKQAFQEKYGSDLFITDIDEYDRICKVEPFGRALKTLQVDVMINGRRRDHGAERAHLELFEAGDMAKAQPLTYWEFRDCFDYLERHGVPAHPLHAKGYPSIGDVISTVPVPRQKWFEYGGERSGRFQGLKNKDGSDKTECGIHVGDAREVAKA
jgi:phosphoadenosine phosphosulfate reductase